MNAFQLLASSDPMEHVLDHRWGIFSKHMLMLTIAAGLCLWVFPLIVRRIETDGTGGRLAGLFEVILIFLRDDVVRPFLGKEGDKYLWIVWTLFFFILFCNLLGLIPGSATATGNINVTAALALFSLVFYHVEGVRKNGLVPYLRDSFLVGPWYLWPLMIPIEAASHIIKPLALMIRLCANMMAGHLMLAIFIGFTGVLATAGLVTGSAVVVLSISAAVAITFLELLVAFLQAFIFAFLTTVFLSMALHPEH